MTSTNASASSLSLANEQIAQYLFNNHHQMNISENLSMLNEFIQMQGLKASSSSSPPSSSSSSTSSSLGNILSLQLANNTNSSNNGSSSASSSSNHGLDDVLNNVFRLNSIASASLNQNHLFNTETEETHNINSNNNSNFILNENLAQISETLANFQFSNFFLNNDEESNHNHQQQKSFAETNLNSFDNHNSNSNNNTLRKRFYSYSSNSGEFSSPLQNQQLPSQSSVANSRARLSVPNAGLFDQNNNSLNQPDLNELFLSSNTLTNTNTNTNAASVNNNCIYPNCSSRLDHTNLNSNDYVYFMCSFCQIFKPMHRDCYEKLLFDRSKAHLAINDRRRV